MVLDLVHLGSVVIERNDGQPWIGGDRSEDLDVAEDLGEAALKIVMLNGKQMNALLICVWQESAIGNT